MRRQSGKEMGAEAAREWIAGDETAMEMLSRLERERPNLLLPPPLHALPFPPGSVLELVGPSPSAKTHILMHAALHCMVPHEYGGSGSIVLFIDLDCRFDVNRLAHLLKARLARVHDKSGMEQKDGGVCPSNGESRIVDSCEDDPVFVACMRRFVYTRCYSTLEFLATLKTLHNQLQEEKEAQGVGVRALMIDSISAHYWLDRASSSFHHGGDSRKSFSLQNVSEVVVQEIKKLLQVHPLLVIVTKSAIFADRHSGNEAKWDSKGPASSSISTVPSRDYMPSVWQKLVTHRTLLHESGDHQMSNSQCPSLYTLEWSLPPLDFADNFLVNDVSSSASEGIILLRIPIWRGTHRCHFAMSRPVSSAFDVPVAAIVNVPGSQSQDSPENVRSRREYYHVSRKWESIPQQEKM